MRSGYTLDWSFWVKSWLLLEYWASTLVSDLRFFHILFIFSSDAYHSLIASYSFIIFWQAEPPDMSFVQGRDQLPEHCCPWAGGHWFTLPRDFPLGQWCKQNIIKMQVLLIIVQHSWDIDSDIVCVEVLNIHEDSSYWNILNIDESGWHQFSTFFDRWPIRFAVLPCLGLFWAALQVLESYRMLVTQCHMDLWNMDNMDRFQMIPARLARL